jgi:hypothetical protein
MQTSGLDANSRGETGHQEGVAALSCDPVLYEPAAYTAAREANSARQRTGNRQVLGDCMDVRPLPFFERFEWILATAGAHLGEVDPTFSTVIRQWIAGLSNALQWVRNGTDPQFFDYVANPVAFESDLAVEYPHLANVARPHPRWVLRNFLAIVPVEAIASSPRLGTRVQQCLPDFPDSAVYRQLDDAAFDRVVGHVDRALDALKSFDETAYEGFRRNVHTLYLSAFEEHSTTMGSRADCPGSIIAAFSPGQLISDDIYSTAAGLYHEHCHSKLALFCELAEPLPVDQLYVSAFKNELRDIEAMLHTAYPVAMECRLRLAFAHHYTGVQRDRAVARLVALGFRLSFVAAVIREFAPRDATTIFKEIGELAAQTVVEIETELDGCGAPLREAHLRERQRVLDRHVWDIGQFLCRDVPVRDPDLGDVESSTEGVRFTYRGRAHTAVLQGARVTPGDYGSYVEQVLARAAPVR